MIHELKIYPQHFESARDGLKTAELRKNDRNFQVGDRLHLREWHPFTERYTGRYIDARITHMLTHRTSSALITDHVQLSFHLIKE